MKKLLLFAAVAGLGLVSASPPGKGPDNGEREARRHYPPCSRTVTDRCIQLYERGRVRDEHAEYRGRREHREHDAYDDGGHRGHREHYADRDDGDHHARGDHRGCRDHAAGDHRPAHRMVRAARVTRVVGCRCYHPPRRQLAQRVRRAGERG
jgi:hypothetical protein